MTKLREIRQRKEMTQLQVAAMTGIAPNVLSELENGRRRAYPGWRRRLAMALKVSQEELFPEENKMKDAKEGF